MHNNGFEKVTELIRMSNLERFKANKKNRNKLSQMTGYSNEGCTAIEQFQP